MDGRTENAELKSRSRRVIEDILNGHEPEAMTELLDGDLIVHGMGADTDTRGLEAFNEVLAAWRNAVPNSEDHIDDTIAEGDTVVLFCTRSGTQEGEYPGIPTSAIGNSFEIAVIHKLRFEDGKVVEWWRLANALGMAQQLGILPDSPGKIVRLMVGQMKHRLTGR